MDGRDLDCRFETDGEFVVAGGHGPVLLEAADSALDRMPGLVVRQLAFSLQKLSQNAGGGLAVHGERRSHSSYCWSGRGLLRRAFRRPIPSAGRWTASAGAGVNGQHVTRDIGELRNSAVGLPDY